MTISTNSLMRFIEFCFDFFVAAVGGFLAFSIFNSGSETPSLFAYLVGAAGFLVGYKLMRNWVIVTKTNSDPIVKLGA